MADFPHDPSWLVSCRYSGRTYYYTGDGWSVNIDSAARYAYRARAESVRTDITDKLLRMSPAREEYEVVTFDNAKKEGLQSKLVDSNGEKLAIGQKPDIVQIQSRHLPGMTITSLYSTGIVVLSCPHSCYDDDEPHVHSCVPHHVTLHETVDTSRES